MSYKRMIGISTVGLILLVVVLLLLFGGLPTWGYHSYGWGISGLGGLLLVILIVLLVLGRI